MALDVEINRWVYNEERPMWSKEMIVFEYFSLKNINYNKNSKNSKARINDALKIGRCFWKVIYKFVFGLKSLTKRCF